MLSLSTEPNRGMYKDRFQPRGRIGQTDYGSEEVKILKTK